MSRHEVSPAGAISPGMAPREKAEAYIDLMLAPSGQAVLVGEPATFTARLGHENLMHCNADELEIIAAFFGLQQITAVNFKVVLCAITKRPAVLPTLCAWLAYTPYVGSEAASGFSSRQEIDFKEPESFDGSLSMTPEQRGSRYYAMMHSCLELLDLVVSEGGSWLIRDFCNSRHARKAMLRLVALCGHSDRTHKAKPTASEMAIVFSARDILCALCTKAEPCATLLDCSKHPFLESVAARAAVEAISNDSPLQLPPYVERPSSGESQTESPVADAFAAISTDAVRDGALAADTLAHLSTQLGCYLDGTARDAATLRFLDGPHFFAEGTRVTLVGLSGRKELNGSSGRIAGKRPSASRSLPARLAIRYPVAVDGEPDGKPLAVQPGNLRLAVSGAHA